MVLLSFSTSNFSVNLFDEHILIEGILNAFQKRKRICANFKLVLSHSDGFLAFGKLQKVPHQKLEYIATIMVLFHVQRRLVCFAVKAVC